jgi:tripartite-type tricarboxylate transporter receptor subunit TctC
MPSVLKSLGRCLTLATLLMFACHAWGQSFPSRPIRLVVPSAAGGSTDTVARVVGNAVAASLGVAVVIDNKPGAGGNIASELVAAAAPDGYTLLVPYGGFAINPSLYPKLAFDSLKDFAPVILLCSVTGILVVNPAVPAQSVSELIALAKAKPGKLNFASAGSGTVTHLAGEEFKMMAGIDVVHVPYKGSSFALNDLMGGQVQMMFANLPGTIQLVEAGKLRVLAVNGAERSPLLPKVPTIAESGLAGYEASTWFGVLAPAGTPKDVVAKLNAEFAKALRSREVAAAFATDGATAAGGSPEQFGTFIRGEMDKWGKVVRASGAKVD